MIENSTSEIIGLFQYLNQTGGKIPIEVTSTISTNPFQFYTTIAITLVSSIFIFIFLWNSYLQPMVSGWLARLYLKGIKRRTGRNLIMIKHTNAGFFDQSMINQETLTDLNLALAKFKGKPFDLVLHTPGGQIFSSLFISRVIKEYPGEVRVMIPYYAMSGGTLLALSGEEIFMSPIACLGPVDPQLGNLFKYGSSKSWNKIVKFKGKKAEDSTISFAFMGEQYTKSISKYISSLLIDKMSIGDSKRFVSFLTSGDVEHGYPLTLNAAKSFGLNVKPLDSWITKKLNKVINSKLFEGVYYI